MSHLPSLRCFCCRFCGQCLECHQHTDDCKLSTASKSQETDSRPQTWTPKGGLTTALGALIGGGR